jgi:hypothetical protein
MVTSDDILFLLSGGASNNNPNLSLGGDPSSIVIQSNRLFSNLSEQEIIDAQVDYRCLYVTNNNGSDSLYDADFYIDEVPDGASAKIGFLIQDERQLVTISGVYSGGDFTLSYDSENFTVAYNSNTTTWASAFQTAIRAIENLDDVTVTGQKIGTTTIFTIDFVNGAGKRWHPALVVEDNSLTTYGESTITVSKSLSGSPINSISEEIVNSTTKPNNITFYTTSENAPVSIGTIRPLDVIPIWIQRTAIPETAAVENDGLTIKIKGRPISS